MINDCLNMRSNSGSKFNRFLDTGDGWEKSFPDGHYSNYINHIRVSDSDRTCSGANSINSKLRYCYVDFNEKYYVFSNKKEAAKSLKINLEIIDRYIICDTKKGK